MIIHVDNVKEFDECMDILAKQGYTETQSCILNVRDRVNSGKVDIRLEGKDRQINYVLTPGWYEEHGYPKPMAFKTFKNKITGETMTRRTFKLLKDTADYKKGVIVQEACDNGDQEYKTINHDEFVKFDDHQEYFDDNETSFSRKAVEQNPKWFVEVFPATSIFLTKEELDIFNTFMKKKK